VLNPAGFWMLQIWAASGTETWREPGTTLWGATGKTGKWYEPLEVWRQSHSGDLTGGPVASGHYLAEEAPDEVIARFRAFFG
jgi:haloacetate dehalogenase